MAQRALIIGLGSTGYDVCDYIAQRIQWEHGGLEHTPWLKFLVLETEAQHGTSDLDRNFFHLTVDSTAYANVINSPARYKDQLDLESWWDRDALLSLQDRAITKGAGNIRMVGRLAFLFPGLCNRIRDEIQVRLDALRRLTPQEAQSARGPLPDGTNPALLLGDDIIVYVVGTLCGGTCSGAFIDLGYLLHYAFAANGYPLQRVGLFSLPNLAYDPLRWQRRRANAFAALKELNHYMSGNDYSVQYPFHPGRPENATRYSPYDTTYLSQPTGGDEQSFEEVKVTTAQFLHNDIFNPEAAQLGARTVDGSASMFAGDKNGSPVTFYSFGMSALEIPGYLIAQGCCYKLGVESFDALLAPRPNALQEADAFRIKTLGLSSEQVASRLLRDPNGNDEGNSILARIKDQIAATVAGASSAGPQAGNDLGAGEERINRAFAPKTDDSAPVDDKVATSALPPHVIPLRVNANLQTLREIYARGIDREIQLALRDPARGPVWCDAVLGETCKWLETRGKELASGANAEALERSQKSAKGALAVARSRVDACATDPFVGLFLGRKRAVERELVAYSEAANAANRKRLDAMLLAPEKMLWEGLLPLVRAMQTQISGTSQADDTSILAQARQMRGILARKLAKIDEAQPVLNGRALFEPSKTIDANYLAFWNRSGPGAKLEKQNAWMQSWTALPHTDPNSGQLLQAGTYFVQGVTARATGEDLTRELTGTAESLARSFRSTFSPLLQESILARPEIGNTTLLQDVRDKSAVKLGLNRTSGLVQLTGANEVDLVFFQGAKNAAGQPSTKAHAAYNSLSAMRAGGVGMQFEESTTPQDLLLVRALGGFSLPMVSGFQPPTLEGNNFRQSFDLESEKLCVHSRTGVKWMPFDGDRDGRLSWRQGLLLSGRGLSKDGTADGILVKQTPQGFAYSPPRPLGPGLHTIYLPPDLREAATMLREQPAFEACLENDIKVLRQQLGVEGTATCLEWVYGNCEALKLWRTESRFSTRYEKDNRNQIQGVQHTSANYLLPAQAFELLNVYWKNDPALVGRLGEPFKQNMMPAEQPVVPHFPGSTSAPSAPQPQVAPQPPVAPQPQYPSPAQPQLVPQGSPAPAYPPQAQPAPYAAPPGVKAPLDFSD